MHWSAQYIGEPYVVGTNDCASFATKVQKEVFNRTIVLPQERASNVMGWSEQIKDHKNEVVIATIKPKEGDAVLMLGKGRTNHIGIYIELDKVPYVLHAMKSAKQICLHKISSLKNIGLMLEGYYKWIII